MTDAAPTVTRNDEKHRYELHEGDVLAGFTHYRRDAQGRAVFDHTEIDPAFEGRGFGSVLVADALADAAERGETVVPECPFVVRYLRRHEVAGLRVHWRDETGGDAASAAAVSP